MVGICKFNVSLFLACKIINVQKLPGSKMPSYSSSAFLERDKEDTEDINVAAFSEIHCLGNSFDDRYSADSSRVMFRVGPIGIAAKMDSLVLE